MRDRILVVNIGLIIGVIVIGVMLAVTCMTFAADPAQAPSSTAQPQQSRIAPQAAKLLTQSCHVLSSADAFSFHAEIMFDQVLPSAVKVQFAGAMDMAMQRPNQLAVDYHSDLGAKQLWYSGDTLTIFDSPHMVYATVAVPSTIDGMLDRLAETHNVTIPLSDFVLSDPCQLVSKPGIYGGYIGIGDVNGIECDHVALSSSTTDWQVWLDRSGKPVPRKVVINYRSLPGSPEYIAFLSDWKFPKTIAASHFRPDLPANAKKIGFVEVKEAKP
jgi:hypothetical protein